MRLRAAERRPTPSRSSAKRAVARFFVFTHPRPPGRYGSRSRFATTPLETALADDPVERLAVLERRDELHPRPLDVELLEQRPPLEVRQRGRRQSLDREHVEDEVDDRDRPVAVEHPPTQPVEVRPPVIGERDELAVELDVEREHVRELGQQRRHVPAAPAARPETLVRADAAAEPVQLRLEQPAAAAAWDRIRAGEHRFGQPQHASLRL